MILGKYCKLWSF